MESQWLKIDNHTIHYVEMGNGFPLVLLHGGANDWRGWKKNIVALAQRYRVIAPDVVGFGRSDKSKSIYGIDDFVNYLWGFVSALNIERMHLAGHSLGGRIALEFACHYPNKVEKLIPVAPFGFGRLSTWGFILGVISYWGRKLFFKKRSYPTLDIDYSKDGFKEFMEKLKNVEVPAMIIWGEKDPYLPVKQAYIANSTLSNSRVEVMRQCRHIPQSEEHDIFNKLVLDFLAEDTVSQSG
jgi:pimeloyl-ACP methyl ester carboxylesterase